MESIGALSGIRVLDFSRFMQGPHCSQMLGDMGAEIIKVERVGTGDENRSFPFNLIKGINAFFLALNRNKKSVTVNLKDDRGKNIIRRLVKKCDVVLENFRPGTMEKLGFSYEELSKLNPGLIYCSCSGYGPTGPYKDKAGQDLLAQSMSGLASITGRTDGPPRATGVYVADAYGAMLAALGIVTALYARNQTGQGQKVDVCLLDAALHMQCQELSLFLNGGHFGPRENEEIAHPLEPPPYGIYKASDGKYLAISSGPWPIFCGAIGMEDLENDQRFDSPQKRRLNKADLFQIVASRIKKNTASYWLNLFEKRDVWSAPVYDYHEVSQDVQVKANEMIITQNYADIGEFKTVGNPIKLSATPASYRNPPPVLGQDTDAILRDLEISQEVIEQYKKDGVV